MNRKDMNFLILTEAPDDEEEDSTEEEETSEEDTGDEETPDTTEDDTEGTEEGEEDTEGESEDDVEDTGDDEGDMDDDDESDEDESNGIFKSSEKEQLFNALLCMKDNCLSLLNSIEKSINIIEDEKIKHSLIEAKKILLNSEKQTTSVLTRFSEIDHSKSQIFYQLLKERITSVSKLIEHVIDIEEKDKTSKTNKA